MIGTDTQHSVGGFSSLQYSAWQASIVGSCRCTHISKYCAGDVCCGGCGIGSSYCTSGASSWELDYRNCPAPGGGCIAQLKQLVTDDFSCFGVIMRNISLTKKYRLVLINCLNIKVYNLYSFSSINSNIFSKLVLKLILIMLAFDIFRFVRYRWLIFPNFH